MSRYALRCECGKDLSVDLGDAGRAVTCECGRTQQVPALRNLRQLPPAEEKPTAKTGGWRAQQALGTVGILIALALAGIAGYLWWTGPRLPQIDPVARAEQFNEHLESLTPAGGYQMWNQYYRNLGRYGFSAEKSPAEVALENEIARRSSIQLVLLATAGAVLVAALLMLLIRGG